MVLDEGCLLRIELCQVEVESCRKGHVSPTEEQL